MANSLNQQVILITGASSGIGAAVAELLAQRYPKIRLVLAARRVEKLEAVAAQCRQQGAEVLVVPTDMTQTDQVKALANKAVEHFTRVDILVNNAGYGQFGPVELIPPDAIRQQLELNLVSCLTLTQALIPVMRSQGGGRIINLSSLSGRIAFPFNGIYNASKFALEGVSDALRLEVAPFNIPVILIEPGAVKTEFFGLARQQQEQILDKFPDNPYLAILPQLKKVMKIYAKGAWMPDRAARIILRAMTDKKPKARYVAASQGSLLLFVLKWLPTAWLDRLQTSLYNLDLLKGDREI